MAIAGRLHDRLQASRVRGVASPEVATYRIRRGRLRAATVAMTVQAPNAAQAAVIAMDVLRDALGSDSRSWDVAGTGATIVPVLSVVPPTPSTPSSGSYKRPDPGGGRAS